MNTIFSKIIKKEIPSYIIYEDEKALAFLDIYPDANGHTLIIPKSYYLDVEDIDDNTYLYIKNVGVKVKQILKEKLKIDGFTFRQNNGDAQDIKHYHLHLIPFYNEKQEKKDIKEIFNILTSKE